MAWAPLARLVTVTGVVGEPAAPSSPRLLDPQHRTSPPVSSAQLWLPPAAIATTPPVRPVGWTGWAELATFEPSPSWWKKLPPQHQTPPPASAQVWLSPAEMATTPLVRFATWTMWEELGAVTLGLPSWPEPLTPSTWRNR